MDGMDGMATVILLGMAAIIVGALVIFLLIGRVIAARAGSNGNRRGIIAASLLVGLAVGIVGVTATFFEATWQPPPHVRFNLPADFKMKTVFLLQDPKAPTLIAWTGSALPFSGYKAEISVPPSGVVRVRDLGPLAGRMDMTYEWSDGSIAAGGGGGPGPEGTGADSYMMFGRGEPDPNQLPYWDSEALGHYIIEVEAGNTPH